MKENDIDNLIDRLQGFDSDELQREMTDGLDSWCQRRRQRGRTLKRGLLLTLLLFTTTAIALTALPLFRTAKSAASAPAPVSPAPTAPRPIRHPVLADSAECHKVAPAPVDYYYTGVAEEGYSVAYGHDTRTLTYTRYSGGHLILSVIPNSSDLFFSDTAQVDSVATHQDSDSMALLAVRSQIACDFQTVSAQGDALYFTILDSASRRVSVRGDVARWMGQPIRYNAILTLPSAVAHDSVLYSVTAIADSAFMGHDEIETVVIPTSVTVIGANAFADCLSLAHLQVLSPQPPEAAPTSFDHVDATLLLSVPCGSANAYSNDVEWLYFRRIDDGCTPSVPHIRVIRRPDTQN